MSKFEKLIKDLNKELEDVQGEIGVGNENGKDNYYFYLNGELELVTFDFIEILKSVKEFI